MNDGGDDEKTGTAGSGETGRAGSDPRQGAEGSASGGDGGSGAAAAGAEEFRRDQQAHQDRGQSAIDRDGD